MSLVEFCTGLSHQFVVTLTTIFIFNGKSQVFYFQSDIKAGKVVPKTFYKFNHIGEATESSWLETDLYHTAHLVKGSPHDVSSKLGKQLFRQIVISFTSGPGNHLELILNPFSSNAPLLYLLKKSRNWRVFDVFRGIEKEHWLNIGQQGRHMKPSPLVELL